MCSSDLQSAKTGITATLDTAGSSVILTNSTGNNIVVGKTLGQAAAVTVGKYDASSTLVGAAVSLASAATAEFVNSGGYIVLDSQKSFATDVTTSNQFTDAGSTLQTVANLDVTTFTNATNALKTVDSALAFISSERAKLGALQSRFETATASLHVTSENLAASRSRIQDADFAAETANLSRAQILQQAGTAMVAQANQVPQTVLQLLK